MAEYHIRTYEDRDYEAVCTIFSYGVQEHAPASCWHILRLPQTHVLLLGVFLIAYVISASLLFSLGVVATFLVMGWIYIKGLWTRYVQAALASDLQDIRKTYLEPKDCCFWVATSGKEVVGMVAAVQPEDPSYQGHALELKRMSVAKMHRGHGLSKVLTRTVIRFAQERGYKEVVLGTSMVQYAAQRVYEGIGFRKEYDSVMAEYHIRTYEDGDYEAVCTIFSYGIQEHAPAGCWYFLRCPQTHALLLGVFLVTYMISASLLFSLGVVAIFLVMGWIYIKGLWTRYVQAALASDLQDIRKTYLEPKDCCFWVATSGKEVVGMVAAVQPEDPSYQGHALELKRMSVAKKHRGHGLSKVLTRTVIRFAQERGYKEVVLGTSMVQYAAQRVYEGIGFRKVNVASPFLLAKLVQFSVYYYCYQITGSH